MQYYYINEKDYGVYNSLTTGKCNTKHAKRILKELEKGPLWMPRITKKKFLYQAADRMVKEGAIEKVQTKVSGVNTTLYALPGQTIKELNKIVTSIEESLDISNDKDTERIIKSLEQEPLTSADLVKIIGNNSEYIKRRLNLLIKKDIVGKAGKAGKTFVQYYYLEEKDYGVYEPLKTGKCNSLYAKSLLKAIKNGPVWLPSLKHNKYACIRNGAEKMVEEGLLKRFETKVMGNKRVYYDLTEPYRTNQNKRNIDEIINHYEKHREPFSINEIKIGATKDFIKDYLKEKRLKMIRWGNKDLYLPKAVNYFYINNKIRAMHLEFKPEWKIKAYYLFVDKDRCEIAKEFNKPLSFINSKIPEEYDETSLYLLNTNFEPEVKHIVKKTIKYRNVSYSDYESVNRPICGSYLSMACSAKLKLLGILSSIPGAKSRTITQKDLVYPKEQFNNLLLNKFDLVASSMNLMQEYCLKY